MGISVELMHASYRTRLPWQHIVSTCQSRTASYTWRTVPSMELHVVRLVAVRLFANISYTMRGSTSQGAE